MHLDNKHLHLYDIYVGKPLKKLSKCIKSIKICLNIFFSNLQKWELFAILFGIFDSLGALKRIKIIQKVPWEMSLQTTAAS